MKVYEFDDYKKFLKAWIESRPKKGRGEMQAMAKFLNIHSTMMSHVAGGNKDLSVEQGLQLSEYLGLNDLECDYFLTLIQLTRAGTHQLKKRIDTKLEEIKNKSQQIKNRLPKNIELKEEDKGVFYSSWIYSALRLMATIPKYKNKQDLLKALNYPPKLVNEILEFLLKTGLCIEENEEIKIGPSKTHLSKESPFIWRHHQNWRLKAMERYQKLDNEELIFSSPLTISKKDMGKVREKLVQLIEEVSGIVDQTDPEELACLNIDWIKAV